VGSRQPYVRCDSLPWNCAASLMSRRQVSRPPPFHLATERSGSMQTGQRVSLHDRFWPVSHFGRWTGQL